MFLVHSIETFIYYFSLQTNTTTPCNPSAIGWYHSHAKDKVSCITSCQGVYADVNYYNELTENRGFLFKDFIRMYTGLKEDFTSNFLFSKNRKEANALGLLGKLT